MAKKYQIGDRVPFEDVENLPVGTVVIGGLGIPRVRTDSYDHHVWTDKSFSEPGGYTVLMTAPTETYEVVMTVRRRFTMAEDEVDEFVENQCREDPDGFVGAVNRSDIDWEWRAVD